MNENRKEPTLSPIKPDQDEINHHRQRANGGRGGNGGNGGNGGPPRGGSGPQRPVVVRSKLAPFALLLAITGLGLAGVAYWQLLQTQQASQAATQAAVARITELEQRLELTGDESEQSVTALQAKLKWADSEIRKLWGVAYDTNRKTIAENKSAIAEVNQEVDAVEKRLTNALESVRGEVGQLKQQLQSQQAAVDQVAEARVEMQQQTRQLADSLRQVRETQSAMQNSVQTIEQDIEAINTFRRSVNRDLLELKSIVGGGGGGGVAPTTP